MTDNEKRFIKGIFSGDSSGYDYYHTIREYKLATKIAKQENAVDFMITPKIGMTKEEYQKNQNSTSINHFYEKLLLLKDMMNTIEGRKLAEHRQSVMQEFLNEFMIEWEGKM